jgi:hypothetical protein
MLVSRVKIEVPDRQTSHFLQPIRCPLRSDSQYGVRQSPFCACTTVPRSSNGFTIPGCQFSAKVDRIPAFSAALRSCLLCDRRAAARARARGADDVASRDEEETMMK